MRFSSRLIFRAVLPAVSILCLHPDLRAQQAPPSATVDVAALPAAPALPEAPEPQNSSAQPQPSTQPQPNPNAPATTTDTNNPPTHKPPPQPKRILGIMPNYRAVSAGVIPPPPTPREAFMVATRNSFDYSAFVFVGVTSLLAEGTNAHPQLGKGVGGFWAYYWRGYLDKTDGNYWVDWAMPTVFHQDERYYAKGEGNVFKRGVYAATRVLITPNYHGKNSFNASEVLGRGISQAISLSYYPSKTQTASGYAQKYGYAIGRDALTNVFREVWPDINEHLFHRHR
jgi:hypothetical protein